MQGEKALFDFAREYLGHVPIWSEGGCEDYVGLMDGGWFMDWRPPEEIGVHAARRQYYPLIDQVHRERLLNMGIYYPLDRYDAEMVNAAILFGRPQAISVYYGVTQEDVSGRLKVYYLTKAFHRMLGLSRMDRIDFQDDDIDRSVVSYSNGARVWSNRSGHPWDVEGLRLPPWGWLIRGPGGFLEFRAEIEGGTEEVVRSDEYDFFSSAEKRADFGPVTCDGALAIARSNPNRILIYEIQKPTGAFELRLDKIPGVGSGRRVVKVDALLTRGRRLPLEFPDFRQRPDSARPAVPGNCLEIRPVEMEQTLGYEVALEEEEKEAH